MNLRPLGIGELLDAAMKVCTANLGPLLRIVLWIVIPTQLLSVVILASTTPEDWTSNPFDFSSAGEETATDDELVTWFAGQGVWLILVGVMQIFATAACFRAIAQAWLGEKADAKESLRFALKRSPALLWVTILYYLAVIVGFVFCIVPGIWLAILFGLATPIVLIEGANGPGALKRSAKLVKDRWWMTFAVLGLGYLFAGFASGITQALVSLPLFIVVDDSSVAGFVVRAFGESLGYLIALPFQAALVAVVYFDLRVRKEGLDIQLLASRIGSSEPGDASASPWQVVGQSAATAPQQAQWPGQPAPPPGPMERQPWQDQQEWQPPSGWEPPEPGR